MNYFNDKIFLTKDAAKTIARYLQICYLWVPPEQSGSCESELKELRETTKKLHDCLVAIELDMDLWLKLNHVVDEELEGLFFKEFCDPLLYEGIKVRFKDFKDLNIKDHEYQK